MIGPPSRRGASTTAGLVALAIGALTAGALSLPPLLVGEGDGEAAGPDVAALGTAGPPAGTPSPAPTSSAGREPSAEPSTPPSSAPASQEPDDAPATAEDGETTGATPEPPSPPPVEEPTTPPVVERPPEPERPAAPGGGPQVAAVVDLVNEARREAGCASVQADHRLVAAAQRHSEDMARQSYFSHSSPDGRGFVERANEAGYPRAAGENIAMGARDARQVMDMWMESPGHRQNILNCSVVAIGVGLDTDGWYWTQVFGG
ncbi:CAP domain-containing protein [Actinoalloteichus spitiensis]|uniref:CAP domain-containing protein n=1 Tax=Actinoalloteichus spitiensis TaxID=252394 RepID=UPI001FE1C305|nr:CAP domain-containing protein [Actinoalloteichus spitiensis]